MVASNGREVARALKQREYCFYQLVRLDSERDNICRALAGLDYLSLVDPTAQHQILQLEAQLHQVLAVRRSIHKELDHAVKVIHPPSRESLC
ncbi:hypothetical protein TRICI_003393 [Trichomonascus ciferrii]|uniref:Uncharacterized protein n=1 Tax=Trichomonascus ciferrii TaxID=44093 RepID=A0A642V426_9ASCO|nr:hypothetical protein TRICI_003393 [Trichomonascus ciferrii]